MPSSGESSIDRPVAELWEYRVVKDIEEADDCGVCAGSARIAEGKLRAESQLKVIADIGNTGGRQNGGERLTGRAGDQLVVVKLIKQKQVLKRRFQSDVLDIVAQVRKRVLDYRISKHMMAGVSAQGRDVAEIALNTEGSKIFQRRPIRKV